MIIFKRKQKVPDSVDIVPLPVKKLLEILIQIRFFHQDARTETGKLADAGVRMRVI